MHKNYLTILLLVVYHFSFGQLKPIEVSYFYPKNEASFNSINDVISFDYESKKYGKTTMIVHSTGTFGSFDFIFKKKILKLTRTINFKNVSVEEEYNMATKKWKTTENSNAYPPKTEQAIDTTTYSTHHLYAIILAYDHGGVVEKVLFQDFGNEIYWPEFDYKNCSISDENKDGIPEFYLTYMGNSDGLDAKPLKQIIYSFANKKLEKSKATAYFPAGNEEDTFHIEYDINWKKLHKAIQTKSQKIINQHK
ncbi:hypothetical protein [Flavobacterium sp. FPG59]|jgi:hypothetical protein|uniref:hypothetical protein n=1 Tax=Flavobacterium sp. FPG59 TaxID=1929267 RepID=UPI000A3A1AEE|nr:hypothetical protein [Flavobacterium sp. FPG59]OUD36785.1 hypothetical protein FPG59_04600 [Flavobacterium sp. FPG59]